MLDNKDVQGSPRNSIRVFRDLAGLYAFTNAGDGKINETLLKADILARNSSGISLATKLQLRLERIQTYAKKEATRGLATQLAKETLAEQKGSSALHNGPVSRIYARIQVRHFFSRCTLSYLKCRPYYAKLFSHRKNMFLSFLNQKAFIKPWKYCTALNRQKSLNVRFSKGRPVLPLDGQPTPQQFYDESDLTRGYRHM